MRRRDRIILYLIAALALGTFVFAILQLAGAQAKRSENVPQRTGTGTNR